MAVGRSFYGIFSANNTPDNANFPNGVKFQRNANFTTKTLLATDNVTPVAISIDPFFFKVVPGTGRVVTAIADKGNFGHVCLGSFKDEELTIDNGGTALLSITNIVSSSADFVVAERAFLSDQARRGRCYRPADPLRPTSLGLKSATITVFSDDPAGPHKVHVSGQAQGPRLSLLIADTGNFGKVCVGSFADEPLVLNNGSHCRLTVTGVVLFAGLPGSGGAVLSAADRGRAPPCRCRSASRQRALAPSRRRSLSPAPILAARTISPSGAKRRAASSPSPVRCALAA